MQSWLGQKEEAKKAFGVTEKNRVVPEVGPE